MKVFGLFSLFAASIAITLLFYVLIGLPSVLGGERDE